MPDESSLDHSTSTSQSPGEVVARRAGEVPALRSAATRPGGPLPAAAIQAPSARSTRRDSARRAPASRPSAPSPLSSLWGPTSISDDVVLLRAARAARGRAPWGGGVPVLETPGGRSSHRARGRFPTAIPGAVRQKAQGARGRRPARTAAFAIPKTETVTRLVELASLAAVLVVAAQLRFQDLRQAWPGVHGDEGIIGMLAQSVRRGESIGVYNPQALGQPTAPIFADALMMRLLGPGIDSVRATSATFGLLGVVALWLVARRNFGARTALIAVALMGLLHWQLHFSRVGYPVIAWPLVATLTAGAVMEALRGGGLRWWATAGGLTAAGVYVYNAHSMFVAILALFATFWLLGPVAFLPVASGLAYLLAPGAATAVLAVATLVAALALERNTVRAYATRVGAALAGFGLVIFPMARYALDPANGYFNSQEGRLITRQPDWLAAGTDERFRILRERYVDFWRSLLLDGGYDGVDGAGVTPMVPALLALIGLVGIAMAVRRRHPLAALGAMILLLAPIAAVITRDGSYRRTLVMAPFFALFAAIGLSDGVALAARLRPPLRIAASAVLAAVAVLAVDDNLDNARASFASPLQRFTFCLEITDASYFLDGLPPDSYVYFYSARWSIDYETRRFVAPDARGEDRSEEFGEPNGGYNVTADPADGRPIFVFIGEYIERSLPEVEARYPGGQVVQGGPPDAPTFVAYLPPGP